MKIEIHSYLSCSHLLQTKPNAWDVLLIRDSKIPESEFVTENAVNSLQVQFDDVTFPKPNKVLPSATVIEEAIWFGLSSEELIVSCRAGQSRSAAIAFSIGFEKVLERHSPHES